MGATQNKFICIIVLSLGILTATVSQATPRKLDPSAPIGVPEHVPKPHDRYQDVYPGKQKIDEWRRQRPREQDKSDDTVKKDTPSHIQEHPALSEEPLD